MPFPTLLLLPLIYVLTITSILLSPTLQANLTYYHYIRPPNPPSLKRHRLSAHTRTITKAHLRGWHVLPSGPPFPTTPLHYDTTLSSPNQTVVLFFHGTCGTRAFPSTRVALIKLFSAHLKAHVVTFDYSGFADSSGTPSENALVDDAKLAYEWVEEHLHHTSNIIIYGMSLGSFPALSLASTASAVCVITDSALSTLLDAIMCHPGGLPFRLFPFARAIFHRFLKDRLDNLTNIRKVAIPVLIMHGLEDRMVNVQQSKMLYDAALAAGNQHVQMVGFRGCGHNDIASSEEYLNVVWEFFESCREKTDGLEQHV